MITSNVQDEIVELIITSLEKFHWQNTEIAFFLKVTKLFDLFMNTNNFNFSKLCLFSVMV